MSKKFLNARGGKLLLLAGTDRLDKELMIGQMQGTSPFFHLRLESYKTSTQKRIAEETKLYLNIINAGKYQLEVFPDAGHFIHEDQAEKTASVLADFYRRNDRSALVLPPKIRDLLLPKKS